MYQHIIKFFRAFIVISIITRQQSNEEAVVEMVSQQIQEVYTCIIKVNFISTRHR